MVKNGHLKQGCSNINVPILAARSALILMRLYYLSLPCVNELVVAVVQSLVVPVVPGLLALSAAGAEMNSGEEKTSLEYRWNESSQQSRCYLDYAVGISLPDQLVGFFPHADRLH